VLEPEYIAEVVDPATGAPVPPGTEGELVLTNLGRAASPLIRYRTGDLVTADPPGACACGSWETALPGGIRGRTDDMVVVRGVNLYPSAVEEVVRRFPEVREYRVEVRARGSLAEVALEVEAAGDPPTVCRAVEAALRGAFNLRIPVRPAAEALPRFELKAQRWVRARELGRE
jgi:phenylacetate-CoA ligase